MSLDEVIGKTLERVEGGAGDDVVKFYFTDGSAYEMRHHQNCCESVYLEDVTGDLQDLIGSPLLQAAEEYSNDTPPPGDYEPESYTWTFYHFATHDANVSLRWFGSSNGYYSESVSFDKMT